METNVVRVKLWGMDVGYLSWDDKARLAVFEYEPSFLEQGLDIAPLTMSVNSPRSRKLLPWAGDKDKLYQGLPPMIADSLPDKWGNSLFKAWLRDNHIPTKKTTPVDHRIKSGKHYFVAGFGENKFITGRETSESDRCLE
jgi:serine/threonine-protein kinase HipA